jgi:predicted DNA repair protein MutK
LNLRRLRNKADYETKVSLSSFDAAYAFEIANEVIGGLAMIVKGVRELGVDLARRRMQERRARRGSLLKGMCPCSPV